MEARGESRQKTPEESMSPFSDGVRAELALVPFSALIPFQNEFFFKKVYGKQPVKQVKINSQSVIESS